jgi:pyruvate/2-oxoglutarate dehydrogenase complex dihydrolipoamide acyltransferase (E2) component
LKTSGERVIAGEAVAEVMTDKINLEIEAPATGTLRLAAFGPDDVVPVGAAIGTVED